MQDIRTGLFVLVSNSVAESVGTIHGTPRNPLEYAAIEKAARTPFVESGRTEDAAKRFLREFGISLYLVPEVL